ncbi:MAG: hypothetical protein F6K58_12260 [Symploca sp. SIO2E9]|nr:hypothetical protein [Symploca sp. SIO2E9]
MWHHFFQKIFQKIFRKRSQKVRHRNDLNLEQYITLDKERVSPSRVQLHGIRFNLDQNLLLEIQQAQDIGRKLEITRHLLADLRYYALIGFGNLSQSGLTFCTYYDKGNGFQEAMMRSVISIDGDIIHQIRNDCLENQDFGYQLASAHYWLIDQLLAKLRIGALLNLNQLSWGLSGLSVAGSVIPYIQNILDNPWLLLAPPVMLWLLQQGFKRLLRPIVPVFGRWVLRRLWTSLLSSKLWENRIARGILGWLG